MSRVQEILSWYGGDNPGTLAKLYRVLTTGTTAGTGKLVILPVDQDMEHGPDASFAKNPPAYDPSYHFRLALTAGCSAHAAVLGSFEACTREFAGQLPLILKVNFADVLFKGPNPFQAVTGSVRDALRLGADFIGLTIYPGSEHRNEMYQQARELVAEAKACGLGVVIWSYPRGSGLPYEAAKKELENPASAPAYLRPHLEAMKAAGMKVSDMVETAVDVTAYAVRIACQLGAHIVKVKPPCAYVSADERARKAFDGIPISTLSERVRTVVRAAFNGRRVVIFSGGPAKKDEEVLAEIRAIADGGGFGSIIGRNAFQRPFDQGVSLLKQVMDIYRKAAGAV